MQVHLDRGGQRYGPYSVEEINTYLEGGQVLATDLAWYDGAPDWMPLTQVPGVKNGGAPPPPSPPPPGAPAAEEKKEEEKKEEAGPAVNPEVAAMAAKMNELPEDLKDRQIELEGDTCLYNGWVFFQKKPAAIILGAAVALPMVLICLALLIPAGPMLGGTFYYFLQRKRLRRGGISQMFHGFSGQFVSLMLGFLIQFFILLFSVVPGLLLIWGAGYKFDPYIIGSDVSGFWEGVTMAGAAYYEAVADCTGFGDFWFRLQQAIWTTTSQLTAFMSTLNTVPGWGKLGFFAGAILVVVVPYQLGLRWMFALPMAAHYKMSFGRAMKLSSEQVLKDKTGVLFFFLTSILFNALGLALIVVGTILTKIGGGGATAGGIALIVLGIAGLIFTFAITGTAYVVAYEEFCGRPRKMEQVPEWILYICIFIGTSIALVSVYTVFTAMMSAYS